MTGPNAVAVAREKGLEIARRVLLNRDWRAPDDVAVAAALIAESERAKRLLEALQRCDAFLVTIPGERRARELHEVIRAALAAPEETTG